MMPSPKEIVKLAAKTGAETREEILAKGRDRLKQFKEQMKGINDKYAKEPATPAKSNLGRNAAIGLGTAALAGGAYALYKRKKANEAKAAAEGQAKVANRYVGAALGAGLGGAAGMYGGSYLGGGIGKRMARNEMGRGFYGGINTGLGTLEGLAYGAGAGTLAGAALGGYGGYRLGKSLEKKKPEEKAKAEAESQTKKANRYVGAALGAGLGGYAGAHGGTMLGGEIGRRAGQRSWRRDYIKRFRHDRRNRPSRLKRMFSRGYNVGFDTLLGGAIGMPVGALGGAALGGYGGYRLGKSLEKKKEPEKAKAEGQAKTASDQLDFKASDYGKGAAMSAIRGKSEEQKKRERRNLALALGIPAAMVGGSFAYEALKKKASKTPAWTRSEGKSESGGLNAKGVASYRRENPGSKLQTAVTTKPSKLKPGSKAAKRRKSFCSRMSGVKGPMKDEKGRPTRKALSLRRWNC